MLAEKGLEGRLDFVWTGQAGGLACRERRSDHRSRPVGVRQPHRRARSRPAAPSNRSRRTSSTSYRRSRLPVASGQGRLSAAPLDELNPRSSIAASMSARRLEKARRIGVGMSRQLAQTVPPHLPGESERGQFGPERGLVEGASRLLPQCTAGGRREPTIGRRIPSPGWGRPRGYGAGDRRPGWCGGGRRRR